MGWSFHELMVKNLKWFKGSEETIVIHVLDTNATLSPITSFKSLPWQHGCETRTSY